MPIAASAASVDGDLDTATVVEIDVLGRWDALALSELLAPFHPFLVQHTTDRWVVHARVPGRRDEPLAEALRAIDEWCAERRLDAPVRVTGQLRSGTSGRLS